MTLGQVVMSLGLAEGGQMARAKESKAVADLGPAWDRTWPRLMGGGGGRQAGQPQSLGWVPWARRWACGWSLHPQNSWGAQHSQCPVYLCVLRLSATSVCLCVVCLSATSADVQWKDA